MSLLERIVASKRAEIAAFGALPNARFSPRGSAVAARLRRSAGAPLRLVTEIKHRSPSAGALSTALSPGERARIYAETGATMVSVLCDGPFFGGAWEHVTRAREATGDALVLAKEFVLDEAQIERAAAFGADAVLLIVRILDPASTKRLVAAARVQGLEPLVEIVSEDELAVALAAEATVIGVNARDLDTLAMDAARTKRVLEAIPGDRVALHLSGLKAPADVRAVAAAGTADAALLGEALMRKDDASDVAALLAEMLREADVTAPAR